MLDWLHRKASGIRTRLLAPVLAHQRKILRNQELLREIMDRQALLEEMAQGIGLRQLGIDAPFFSNQWFPRHVPVWELLLADLKGRADLEFLEIGSYEGRATLWLLEEVLTHESARIQCVDTFAGSPEHAGRLERDHLLKIFESNTRAHSEKISVHRGRSQDILPELPHSSFDFVYVDGSHSAENVYLDAINSFALAKPGGIILFDDYAWAEGDDPEDRPGPAIDRFLTERAGRHEVLHRGYQIAIRKQAGD